MFGNPIDNPFGWPVILFSSAVKRITDGTHHSPISYPKGEYLYITAKNIRPWGLDLNDVTYVDKKTHDEIFARCSPSFGDVLYIKDGATTGLAVINTLDKPFSLLSSVALIKPDNSKMIGPFICALLNNEKFVDMAKGTMAGAAITRLTLTKISNFRVILPPVALQKQFAEALGQIDKLRFNYASFAKRLPVEDDFDPRKA